VALRKWFPAVNTYIKFNTGLRQLDVESDVSYKRFTSASSASLSAGRTSPTAGGPVEIGELYVKADPKGRKRDETFTAS
jgi:transposase